MSNIFEQFWSCIWVPGSIRQYQALQIRGLAVLPQAKFVFVCKFKKKQLSARTRAQLVSDSFSLSQATMLDGVTPLNLIKYMSNEIDYLPWNVLLSRVKYYADMLGATRVSGDMQMYLSTLVEKYYKKLGWNDDESQEWLDR